MMTDWAGSEALADADTQRVQRILDSHQGNNRPVHAAVLLNGEFQALHYFGEIGQYLKVPADLAATDFTQIVVDDLHLALSVALQGVASLKGRICLPDVAVKQGEAVRRVDLDVDWIPDTRTGAFQYLVTMTPSKLPDAFPTPDQQVSAIAPLNRASRTQGEDELVRASCADETAGIAESSQAMDAALARLAERLQLATRAAGIGIWDWDIQKNEIVWDDRMYALYGLQPGAFGGAYEAWLQGVHPDDRERSNEVTAAAVRGEAGYDTEFRVLWSDGSVHWLKADGVVFRDLSGKPVRMLGVNYDITARKLLEMNLLDSERRSTLLFQKSTVPVVLLKLPEVVIADANEAAEKLTGFSRQEMLGRTAAELGITSHRQRADDIARFETRHALAEDERQIFTKSGDARIVIFNTNPLRIGDQPHAITSLQDVTERIRAEENLRVALAKYQTLFHTFPLGITITDDAGNIIETNRIAEKLLGISEEEQKQRKIDSAEWRIIRPDATPMPADEYASVRALKNARRVENVEMGIVRPDGDVTWINVTATPLPIDGYGVVITYADITGRKQAENALAHSERLLSEMGAIAKVGGWELDPATLKQEWTDETYAIHDRELGVYDPNSTEEISRFEPGSKEQIAEAFNEAMRMGTPYDLEVEMTTVKGNRKWVRAVCSPMMVDGKVTRLTGTLQDITERKTIEQQSKESERAYRELVHNANSAIVRWTRDGTISFFNEFAQAFFGYDLEDIVGKPVSILVPETDSAGGDLSALVQDILAHPEQFVNVVNENICRDGRRVWMAWTNKPIYDEDGQVREILAVGVDITERKRVEDELRRSNAELEQFAYVASHDLQEPLRTVSGMVQLLQQRYQGQLDERADEYIRFAVDASDRMQQLINDLLDFSRVNRRGRPFGATDMGHVLQAAITTLQAAIVESGAQLTFDALPTVQADAGQMTQVLQNLLSNAIKFRSEKPPKIHIGAQKLENGWQFSVSDNGIGIDPQYFERVFLLFQRLHTRRTYPGTGIGLALCKKVIERHGGRIWIQSALNEGATFFFTIPER